MSKINSSIVIGSCIDIAAMATPKEAHIYQPIINSFIEDIGKFIEEEAESAVEEIYNTDDYDDFEDMIPQIRDDAELLLDGPINDICDQMNFVLGNHYKNYLFYDGIFVCEIDDGYIRTLIKDRPYALKHKYELGKTIHFMKEQDVEKYYIIYLKFVITIKNLPCRIIKPGELK